MPAASDDLMHSFYPLLANAMIQADLNSVEDEGSAAIGVLAAPHRTDTHEAARRPALHMICSAEQILKLGSAERTALVLP